MIKGERGGRLVLPPEYCKLEGPVIFLAGPIQGAPDWQSQAIAIIREIAPWINIASPRRDYFDEDCVYEEQVDWETHYLRRAAENGLILFWLAKEAHHVCERAYAQTSRFELGEWKVWHEKDKVRLVVGLEEGFTNSRYIVRRLSQDCPSVPILGSLTETCIWAIKELS